jgi:hypothetical protein
VQFDRLTVSEAPGAVAKSLTVHWYLDSRRGRDHPAGLEGKNVLSLRLKEGRWICEVPIGWLPSQVQLLLGVAILETVSYSHKYLFHCPVLWISRKLSPRMPEDQGAQLLGALGSSAELWPARMSAHDIFRFQYALNRQCPLSFLYELSRMLDMPEDRLCQEDASN